ncbi:hypothetical protein Pcinc_031137 [Petrolisthes cinctipes]|uniref:Uncharacterized protein n=1 Tax=Petrolisthes cinctipes TaxID=88211 RepID=A0AAE1EX89_PETCI|nr:hypothetical protein Pcinc_031137 [Petrolisthes cinctipes]
MEERSQKHSDVTPSISTSDPSPQECSPLPPPPTPSDCSTLSPFNPHTPVNSSQTVYTHKDSNTSVHYYDARQVTGSDTKLMGKEASQGTDTKQLGTDTRQPGVNISNTFKLMETCILRVCVIIINGIIIFLIFYDPGKVKPIDASRVTLDWHWCSDRRRVVCPRASCGSLANPSWIFNHENGVTECNICQATFTLPIDAPKFYSEFEMPEHSWVV